MSNTAYYYIPLCNKDFTFENIFSSESISPINFYSKRGFGITHFYKIDQYHLDEAILMYNVIPKFKVDRIDGIRFVLALKQSEIEKDDIVFISEGIVGLQKTFYLTKENFKILFFSEKEMRFVQAKSELSLPTKSSKKYYKNFEVIDDASCVEVDTEGIQKVKLIDNSYKEILFDKRYNTIKGFIYGLITEIVFEKSVEEVKLRRCVQQLINNHAEFKNKSDLRNRQSDFRYSKQGTNASVTTYFDKVLDTLKNLENFVFSFFPRTDLTNDTLSDILFENNKSLFNSREEAFGYLRHKFFDQALLNSNEYDFLKKKIIYSLKKPDANSLIGMLKDYFKRNFSSAGTFTPSRSNSDYTDEEFKEIIFKLSFVIEDFFSSKKSSTQINFDEIVFDPVLNEINLKTNFGFEITKGEEHEFIILANIILQKSKREKGEAKKVDLLEIVKAGANALSKSVDFSDTLLYKYLNNQLDIYPLEKVNSVVMKNFVSFIFNPDSMEALEKFLQANEIRNKWMAYSFWCVFNGFANISANFLRPIFDKDVEIQEPLDTYLGMIRTVLANRFADVQQSEYSPIKIYSQEIEFFEKYINGEFKLTLADLQRTLQIKKDSDRLKFLKNEFDIDNKSGKHILFSHKEFMKSLNLF